MKRALSSVLAPVIAGAFAVSACMVPAPAAAQTTSATVVATCGTPPATYPAGANRALTQDTTGTLCSTGSGGGGGGGAVYGPNAVGAAASHPPVIVGGTADATATGTVQVQKVDSSGNAYTSASTVDGGNVTFGAVADTASCSPGGTAMSCFRQMDADIKGTGTVQGTAASGASVSGNPLLSGGRAATAAPTAVTDGQAVAQQLTETGRTVTAPYSIKELMVRGTGNATGTGATTIIASAGGSLKNYITAVQCGRTDAGASALTITFNDSASTVVVLPAGGATNITFPTPLATAAATAFQFTSGTGVTTLYCSAQGYVGL